MSNPFILWDSILEDGSSIAATSTDTGYAVTNVRDDRAYTFHRYTTVGTVYLNVNCTAERPADSLGLYSHNFGSASATITLQGCTSALFADNVTTVIADFTPTDDKIILRTFTAATFQYWRLKIQTATISAKIAVMKLGTRLDLLSPPRAPLTLYQESAVREMQRGKEGHILGNVMRYRRFNLSHNFAPTTNSTWMAHIFHPFWTTHAAMGKPFFYAPDITNLTTDLYFCTIPDAWAYRRPLITLNFADEWTLDMEGVAE